MFVHFIFDTVNGGQYSRVWAALLLYPYTFISALGMPPAKCKLGDFTLANLTTAFAYIPVGFYAVDAYTETWIAGVNFTFAAIVPIFVVLVFKALGLVPPAELPITQRLPFAAADFFDLLVGYFISAQDHQNAVRAGEDDFNEVAHSATGQKIPPRLSAIFWNLAGELFSLKDCLLSLDPQPGVVAYVWKPLAADFALLRSEVGIVLRKTARGVPEEADRNLPGMIAQCEELTVDLISDINAKAAKGSIAPPTSAAVVHFYSSVGSILYIAGLAERYRLAAVMQKEEDEKLKQEKRDNVIRG